MSLLALGAMLEDRHDYQIIDGNLLDDPLAALKEAIQTHDVNILGVTVMPGPQLADAAPTCKALKATFPDLTIIWGGYFPTQHYDIALQAEYVDYVVRGHGEEAFINLLDVLARGGVPVSLNGVAYKHGAEIISNAPAPIPHPKNLPSFPYHRIDLERYIRRTFMGERTLSHHSSYGCPFFCNFCAVVNMVNGRWMAQTADQTAATVRWLVEEHQLDAVEF